MSINRRIVVTAVHTMELREEPIPAPAPGEVRVRSTLIGVCGSDTHAFHGRHPFIPIPYMPGHEATGVVEELGEGVTSVAVGDRIVVEPTLPCWECKPCRSGAENLCENLQFFGCGYPEGGMADQFVVRADRLHLIPDDMSDLNAALIEPLSTPVHAARIAGPLQGRAVAVLGAGTIGLLMARGGTVVTAPPKSSSPTRCPPSARRPFGSVPTPSLTRWPQMSPLRSEPRWGRALTSSSTVSRSSRPRSRRSAWPSRAARWS